MFIDGPVAIVASPVRPELITSTVPLRTTPLAHILDHCIVQISHLGLRASHYLLIKFLEHFFTFLIAKLERSNPFNHLVHGLGLVSPLSVSKLIAMHSLKSKP